MFAPDRKLKTVALAAGMALAGTVGLAGCATTADSGAATAKKGPSSSDVYVYQIDRAAERNGVRVIWVNPPKGGEAQGLGYTLQATVGDEERDG